MDPLSDFVKRFPISTYPKEYLILPAGSHSNFFYFIESGAVKMTRLTAEGDALNVHLFFPQSFFSLLSLIRQGVNQYDFITVVPTSLRKIPQTELTTFMLNHPQSLFEMQLRLLKGIEGLIKRLGQTTNRAYNQVASIIIYYASHFSDTESELCQAKKLQIKITHQEISEWVGLTRENVSLQMKRLEHAGIISHDKTGITILDCPRLKSLAEVSPLA